MRFCLLLLLCFPSLAVSQTHLYTFYTPSHKQLFDEWFLPSLKDQVDLHVFEFPQTCKTARYMSQGWTRTTIRKIEMLLHAIERHPNRPIVYADVDIQFFEPFVEDLLSELKGHDLVIQRNGPGGMGCTGFMAFYGSRKVKRLFLKALALMKSDRETSDQPAINQAIATSKIKWKLLPNRYACAGTLSGQHWNPHEPLLLPYPLILHHANWTVGIENKIAQLELAKEQYAIVHSCHSK